MVMGTNSAPTVSALWGAMKEVTYGIGCFSS